MLPASTIKRIKSLQIKKFRNETGLFIAEGHRLVTDLLSSDIAIEDVFFTNEWAKYATKPNIKYTEVSSNEMQRISGLKTPSTVLATAKIPNEEIDINTLKNHLSIALDCIQDPGNLGTIIRLADWFGIHHIICSPDTADAFSPKVVQATMGAISRVKIIYTNLFSFTSQAHTIGLPTYGTFLDGESIYNAKLSQEGLIYFGNEGNGISDEIEKLVSHKLNIPNFGGSNGRSESLNVAMAAAIVCSEFKRRSI
jgi:RNA methyltransferase, TrmH family